MAASCFPVERPEELPKGTQASGTGGGDCQPGSLVIHLQHPAGHPAIGPSVPPASPPTAPLPVGLSPRGAESYSLRHPPRGSWACPKLPGTPQTSLEHPGCRLKQGVAGPGAAHRDAGQEEP